MSCIRILLADDHELLRAGLRALLDRVKGVEVVGEAPDGHEALALIEKHHPDILLADIAMPGMSGLEVAEWVARDFPGTRTIILSMHTEKEYLTGALRVGAAGYLIKDSGADELELAIRAVARGESYLSPVVSRYIVADYARLAETPATATDPLTPRQREVLKLISQGLPTKAIARRLDISIKTVDTHRVQLMERLGIHGVPGLVKYAIRAGLATVED